MKTLIAIPCMDMIHTAFFSSMMHLLPVGECEFGISQSSLVYDSRNILSQRAVREGFDRMLFLDSDMAFEPDLMLRLSADMDEGRDFVSGIFFTRKGQIKPCVYSEVEYKALEDNLLLPYKTIMEDYPRDQIFPVAGSGMAATMVSVDLIRRVADRYGLPFSPLIGFGEDLSFCKRATELGATLYCDSRVKVGHVGERIITEETYSGTL